MYIKRLFKIGDDVKEKYGRYAYDEYVYFISDRCGHIKIGRTKDVGKRLEALQIAHALPLRLIAYICCGTSDDAIELEKILHSRFYLYRLNGEWFTEKFVIRWLELHNPQDIIFNVKIRKGRIYDI